jgi:hypothetical protein
MKRWLWLGLLLALGAGPVRAAEGDFSQAIGRADFSAAGLEKLSPAELAKLDALVRDYSSGALEAARREVVAADEARVAAEAKAARVEAETRAAKAESAAKKNEPGLLGRAKVLLTPGTQIEYAAIESRIAGQFAGWEKRTVFRLENGQQWRVVSEGNYYASPVPGPKVKIEPAATGGFWMAIDGVKPRLRVVPEEAGK